MQNIGGHIKEHYKADKQNLGEHRKRHNIISADFNTFSM